MNTNTMDNRLDIIHELAVQNPGLGKTAMVKYLFLLQRVYKVPLDYDFEIYTYGPYSSEVMADIGFAEHQNIISVVTEQYTNHIGYVIEAKDYSSDSNFAERFKDEISELKRLFGNKTAKELELLATIVYLYNNYKMNSWDYSQEAISGDVHEIKPHFSLETIKDNYNSLETNGILQKAV